MTSSDELVSVESGDRPPVDPELVERLLAQAGEGAELLGPDGLLTELTKSVLERALAAELTDHLGYEPHDPGGRGSGNSRNGTTPKTLLTDVGAVDLQVPRDRAGTSIRSSCRKARPVSPASTIGSSASTGVG